MRRLMRLAGAITGIVAALVLPAQAARPIAGGSGGLKFAHGFFRVLATDAVGTTYTQPCTDTGGTGTFQPNAIRAYAVGIGTGADASSTTLNFRGSIGFAVSATDRRCIASLSEDNVGTSVCARGYQTDCLIATVINTPAIDGKVDVDALLSTGWRAIVDDQLPVQLVIFWEAWLADVAVIGEIAEPAATGNQNYTVTGFTASGAGQCVLFAGTQGTGAAGTAERADAALMAGMAVGTADGDNAVAWTNSDDASATMDTDRYALTGECLSLALVAGGNPSSRAKLTAWGTNQFTLNWIARGTTNRRYIFLAMKAAEVVWRVDGLTFDGVASTVTVSGLPFTPLGLCGVNATGVASTPGTSSVGARINIGTGSSTTSRRCLGYFDDDAVTTSAIALAENYQALLMELNLTGVVVRYDIDAILSGGYRLVQEITLDTEFLVILSFGNMATPIPSPFDGSLLALIVRAWELAPGRQVGRHSSPAPVPDLPPFGWPPRWLSIVATSWDAPPNPSRRPGPLTPSGPVPPVIPGGIYRPLFRPRRR